MRCRGFLFQRFRAPAVFSQRPQEFDRRRLAGVVLALAVEVLLLLAVLSIGAWNQPPKGHEKGLVSISFRKAPDEKQSEQKDRQQDKKQPEFQSARSETKPDEQQKPVPQVAPPTPTAPTPPLIQLSPKQSQALDLAIKPKPPGASAPPRSPMGPPNIGPVSNDTPRVSGSGPNGEPLYAASWYREPYEDELSGYLSTATGPGWGLIACRTAPDYRVEDCVGLDEYPNGSNITRSVLAAAWQFRVRPPRVGGQDRIGEWVRIRIDYGVKVRVR